MNTKDCDNHSNSDVLSNEAEERRMSSTSTSDLEQQHLGESTHKSCRKRPPGGNSMYSTGASDCNIITLSHSTSHKDSFIMNGTQQNNQWKLNSTTNMSIGNNKRKLKDDGISAKQIGRPLERSEVISDSKKLLTLHQIPAHLRFNRFVLSHYRAPTNWKGCIMSLGYMHNETINILTHGKASSYVSTLHIIIHA